MLLMKKMKELEKIKLAFAKSANQAGLAIIFITSILD
jgi:hypothetical protein